MKHKITTATLLLLGTVLISFMASDQFATASDLETHPVVAASAEAFSISESEALERLELQNKMVVLGNTLAEEQGVYGLGNYLYQHVFWSPTNCTEYKTPFNSAGDPQWNNTTTKVCSTYAPGSGTIESYTTAVSGGYLREAMWRNGLGYVRNIPLNGNTVHWAAAPGWTNCCAGGGPNEQGSYILTHSHP